jgi:TDG/mug DNA glycosylase family protein
MTVNNATPRPKPTRAELLAAEGGRVPDLVKTGLRVLFCGINPGLYSAAVGHHFARPGNRFWPALHRAGFTDRLLTAFEEGELLARGYGITNIAWRATATAAALTEEEMTHGGLSVAAKVRRHRPRFLAVLGVGAYRAAFKRPSAKTGLQPDTISLTKIWVLPNPSGLNAHYQISELVKLFRELREAAEAPP